VPNHASEESEVGTAGMEFYISYENFRIIFKAFKQKFSIISKNNRGFIHKNNFEAVF